MHARTYEVRAYRLSDTAFRLRGAVRDLKPPGTYVAGDPEPLTMHHMVVELDVEYPSLAITAARTHFEAFPTEQCPAIIARYDALVGLSIARGFSRKVRDLFGGPRG